MDVPPLPPKPDLEARPRGSLLWAAFVAFCVLGVLTLAAFFATPILLLAAGIFGIIALQYLLWGWWMGRVYGSVIPSEVEFRPYQFSIADVMLAMMWFSLCVVLISWRLPWPGDTPSEAQQATSCLVGTTFGASVGALLRRTNVGALAGSVGGLGYAILVTLIAPK